MATATQSKTAYVEVRSQNAKGTWPSRGPDTYVTVQVVPEGVERLKCLNYRVAEKRGIKLIYVGEGYRERQKTARSALGAAIAEAKRIAAEINGDTVD